LTTKNNTFEVHLIVIHFFLCGVFDEVYLIKYSPHFLLELVVMRKSLPGLVKQLPVVATSWVGLGWDLNCCGGSGWVGFIT
jgi:hypothetical protein